MKKLLLCCVVALAPACSKGDAEAEKMVSMMEDMGDAIESAGGDCGKMAEGIEAVANKYDLKAMKESAEKLKGDKDKSKELMEKYGDRLRAATPKLMGMMSCAMDPKIKEVNKKFQGVL